MKEIDNLPEFEEWIKNNALPPSVIQDLDLETFESEIINHKFKECLFLGCDQYNNIAGHIARNGGVVIPDFDNYLFKTHRKSLYTPKEPFKGFNMDKSEGYKLTYDYKIYDEYVNTGMENPPSILTSLARRLHDHSITDALEEEISDRKVVAIMGGHSMERGNQYYLVSARKLQ
ncbi:MAG: hypothetical protein PF517_15105 [Salinivirgaceae bacterium]|jgi:hypothetical protein|nr:hypothetical protein [Salinivirgaceae bacterium]